MSRVESVLSEFCSRGCKLGKNPRSVMFSVLYGMLCESYRQYEGREEGVGLWVTLCDLV